MKLNTPFSFMGCVNTSIIRRKIILFLLPASFYLRNLSLMSNNTGHNLIPQNSIVFYEIVVPMEMTIPAKFYCFMATRFWRTVKILAFLLVAHIIVGKMA
jgi:hypothetical protein